MTFNCRFETPCGWCEKFDKACKDVCDMPKNDRFKPQTNPPQMMNSPMDSVHTIPLSTTTIKGNKCK